MISDLKEELLRLYNLLTDTQTEKKAMDGGYNETLKDLKARIKEMKLQILREEHPDGTV